MTADRLRIAAAVLIAATALSGCITPTVKVRPSQAILDARAHRDVAPTVACAARLLTDVSPVQVGFDFGQAELTDPGRRALDNAAGWLACHASTAVVLQPGADSHGSQDEEQALASRRAQAVVQYLRAHGATAPTITILPLDGVVPVGEHLLIQAQGQRW